MNKILNKDIKGILGNFTEFFPKALEGHFCMIL